MSVERSAPQVIEISSSSSVAASPVYHANGHSHDDGDEPMEPRRVSAASRVSLANLLGPTGPSTSPYGSPSGGSPRKRFSDVGSSDSRARSPPYQAASPSISRAAPAPTSGMSVEAQERGEQPAIPTRSTYPDVLGDSSRDPDRRLSHGSPSGSAALQDQTSPPGASRPSADTTAPNGDAAGEPGASAPATARAEDRQDDDDDDDDDDDGSSDGGSASGAEAGDNSRNKDAVKVKRRARRKTPSLPEPIAPLGPPPRPTIRISLAEAKKDGYLVNVPNLVYAQLRTERHPWATWFESQMEVVDDAAPGPALPPGLDDVGGGLAKLLAKYPAESGARGGGAAGDAGKKRRRGGKLAEDDAYDTKDPFVDDSELGVDEPTHFAKPKADGFYVTQGPVELAKIKPSKQGRGSGLGAGGRERVKPLSIRDSKSGFAGSINKLIAKRGQITTAGPIAPIPATAAAPSGGEGSSAGMQVNSLLNGSNGAASGSGSAVSAGSPPHGTPPAVSRQSAEGSRESPIKVDEIDDNAARAKKARYPTRPVDPRLQAAFENLRRLVASESFAVKTKFPPALKPPLVETAKLAVELGEYNDNFFNYLPTIFPYNRFTMMKLTKREFFPHHIKYFKELQDEHMETLGGAMDVDGAGPPAEEELQEPQKRWKWTEEMREEVFTLINIENAMSEVRNEKLKLENAAEQFSEINARKSCYKAMAELFPEDGWTTSTNISREYAQLKKKKDRQEARLGAVDMDDSRASSLMP
ncbi:uncharacterized protein PFL1_00733 [Pseudozyma flocculosa PF-1]|uniref:uncharacterized protein n=1 Tax=Pseudozyma flocculosa PF-1 TaxID=1277687 RepID=UPI0004560F6F|nr:uncharacterized protein PFL1_00733 [Pseudozyma flocculosa PF-1]EPQ31398.1 hypothetical protein PFL1_00733 [Pseudozyma flocculosa PF-1]